MKRRIKLTEGDLHKIVKESVKKVINEIGDKLEKELGLPKGGGKYALAKKAASLARSRGRFNQSDNFDDYAYDSFNKEFGFKNNDGEFGMSGNMRPFLDNNDVPCLSSQDEANKEKRGAIEKAINNFKAYPRMKAKKGLQTFDTVHKMDKNKWKPQEQQPQ